MESLMDEGDRHRAFTPRRRDACDVASAHVADGEDSREAGFQQTRLARERPARGGESLRRQIRAGPDEPVLVERDAALEPARARNGPGHREDVPDVVLRDGPGFVVTPAHALQVASAFA